MDDARRRLSQTQGSAWARTRPTTRRRCAHTSETGADSAARAPPEHPPVPFFFLMMRRPPRSTPFPYTALFRSLALAGGAPAEAGLRLHREVAGTTLRVLRSEEHTSELQSRGLISYAVFCLK